MKIKAKYSKNNEWGFLEKYECYRYEDTGYVRATCSVTPQQKLAPAYIYKGDEFVNISDADKEVGLERYIKAKKPFYAKMKEGFVVVLKASVNFKTKEYYPEKSSYEVLVLNGSPDMVNKEIPFKRLIDVPVEFNNIVKEPLRILGESFGDREKFLRSRMYG